MRNGTRFTRLARYPALTLAACLASTAAAAELSPARSIEVVTVKGNDLGDLQGQAFDQYSVMALKDGALTPIPYQFDDINKRGFPYVPGGELPIDGKEGVVDGGDELVFMLRDTGGQADQAALAEADGTVVAELKMSDANVTRYAYLMKGNSRRADKTYTHVDRDTGLVKTEAWTLQVDTDNPLIWSDMTVEGIPGRETVLDTMKIRAKARLGFIGATVHNRLMPADIIAVKNGPVRSIVEADASISLLGINLLSAGADFIVSRNSMKVPVLATIPGAASVLSGLNIEISLDFHNLEGAKVWTAQGPTEPLVAGSPQGDPKAYAISLEDSWIAGGFEGFDIGAELYVSEEGRNAKVDFLYKDAARDDEADTPERFEGSHPQVGYILSNIPTGTDITLGVNLYFTDNMFEGGYPGSVMEEVVNPMPVEVKML